MDDLYSGPTRSLRESSDDRSRMQLAGLHRRALLMVPGADVHRQSSERGRGHPASGCGRTTSRARRTGVRCWRLAAGSSSAAAPTIACSDAFDASSGALLWEFPTNSGIIGQPSSFMVDGKQYIAVQSGWGVDARPCKSQVEPIVAEISRTCPKAARSGCSRSSKESALLLRMMRTRFIRCRRSCS